MKITKIASDGALENIADPKDYAFFVRMVNAGYIDWTWRYNTRAWVESVDGWHRTLLGYVKKNGVRNPTAAYSFRMFAKIDPSSKKYKSLSMELWSSGANKLLASWKTDSDEFIKSKSLFDFINQKVGIDGVGMIHEQLEEAELKNRIEKSKEIAKSEPVNRAIRLTRRSYQISDARAITVIVRPKDEGGHEIGYEVDYLESGQHEPFKIWRDCTPEGLALTKQEALEFFEAFITELKGVRFVDPTSFDYIPEDVNKSNWDFSWNRRLVEPEEETDEPKKEIPGKSPASGIDIEDLVGQSDKMKKEAQDFNFEGFYSGEIPDYALSYLGSPSVEASQIRSMFGRSDDAISLVNQFDSSLLQNILFVFNFGKSGAYGVYLSELDRAIKTKALKNKLEQKGYQIEVTEKGLTAFPKKGQEMTNEQVQQDIDSIYQDLQSKGGTAIGVNMNNVLNASKSDAAATGLKDPNLWEWMAILHLGGTIAHEAAHAKGTLDEGSAETEENAFIQWALPKVNEKYKQSLISQGKEEEYAPLVITPNKRHAMKKSWYKQSQMSYYIPKAYQNESMGSDLTGRFPYDPQNQAGLADWSKISQYYQNLPIEARLGRQFMSPLPKDIDQANNIIEEQLRKYTREDQKLDTKATMEELLSSGHDKNRGYETLEGLLDEKRTKPLIVLLKKNAMKIKTATLFGWMNNLDLDDGSTIPGLSDRVMEWEDRDESFSQEESWIRQQPRYNPEYDIKGFYYRWIEPRFKPQLFDDMTQDYSGTHPAKRFASSDPIDGEWSRILSILSKAKTGVLSKKLSTRFIVSEDVMPLMDYMFGNDEIKMHVFEIKDSPENEKLFAVWVTCPDVDEERIEKSEKHIQKVEVSEEVDSSLDELFGTGSKKSLVEEIVKQVIAFCEEYNFQDVHLSEKNKRPNYICFEGEWGNHCFIVGEMLAEKLNIGDVDVDSKDMSLAFNYNGVRIVFKNL